MSAIQLPLSSFPVIGASTGIIVSVNNSLACEPIKLFGTEEQRKKYLADMASGRKLGCLG